MTISPSAAAPAKAGATAAAAVKDDPAAEGKIIVGKSGKYEVLDLHFGNRHGLVTGATGTGKTVTLQVLAEGCSKAGVSVFAADVKGDLSGIAAVGEAKPDLVKRASDMGLSYQPDEFPVVFWDVFGAQGHPIRATVSEMGPLLLSRIMQLNDTQEGVLNIAFRVADEQGLPILDLKDLRAILGNVADNAAELQKQYGNVSAATVGTIQRAAAGAGEPGRDVVLRRAGARSEGFHAHGSRRARHHQRPCRRQADRESAALRDVPAVDAVGTVRDASRGRRSRQAEAGVLLRRSASAVQRRAEAAARQDRAGGAPDPLQGRRRLFRHAESARRAGNGAWRSSATACSMRCARSRRAIRRR